MTSHEKFVIEYEQEVVGLIANTIVTLPAEPEGRIKEGVVVARRLIDKLSTANGKMMFVGNGASATISSHFAVDFWKAGGVRATAFNDAALLTCISNDYSYEEVFEYPVKMFADKDDLLVAISSSGQSQNILKAADMAGQKGCKVLTLSGFKNDNPLRQKGDINFFVPSLKYGFVEVIHTYILHCLLDLVIHDSAGDSK